LPSGDEAKRREELATRLPLSRPIGTTRRERLLYAVINRYLERTAVPARADVWDTQAVEELVNEFDEVQRAADADDQT
jgi:NADP-dependent 3-hydroxy acid dehydrogenase YdfG